MGHRPAQARRRDTHLLRRCIRPSCGRPGSGPGNLPSQPSQVWRALPDPGLWNLVGLYVVGLLHKRFTVLSFLGLLMGNLIAAFGVLSAAYLGLYPHSWYGGHPLGFRPPSFWDRPSSGWCPWGPSSSSKVREWPPTRPDKASSPKALGGEVLPLRPWPPFPIDDRPSIPRSLRPGWSRCRGGISTHLHREWGFYS